MPEAVHLVRDLGVPGRPGVAGALEDRRRGASGRGGQLAGVLRPRCRPRWMPRWPITWGYEKDAFTAFAGYLCSRAAPPCTVIAWSWCATRRGLRGRCSCGRGWWGFYCALVRFVSQSRQKKRRRWL